MLKSRFFLGFLLLVGRNRILIRRNIKDPNSGGPKSVGSGSGTLNRIKVGLPGEAVVAYLQYTVGVDQEVAGLDVPVDDFG